MKDPCGITYYTYDYLNRLTSVTNRDNKTISYQYDAGGNRTQLTDPNGGITTYKYDKNNRLTEVNSPDKTSYQYDSLGRLTRTNYPYGSYTVYDYNSQRNWLKSIVNKQSDDTVISSYDYTYDNVGNRLSVTEANGTQVVYGYDDIYQLTSETRTGANSYAITYQYDKAGNRTQKVKDGVTTTYAYNADNQLVTETTGSGITTYNYDLNGNLTLVYNHVYAGGIASYTWDLANRLISIFDRGGKTMDYEYDGAGNRISKTTWWGTVKTKYINDVALPIPQVIMETDEANTVQTTYTYGNDLISMRSAGNHYSDYYFYYDGIGSVRQMAGNMTASVFDNATYDAFGNRIALEGYNLCAYGFTGEQQFDETENVVYLRARYYDTRIGRFISRDPIGIKGGMNLYEYCANNPVNLIDPEGEIFGWIRDCVMCAWYYNKAMNDAIECRKADPTGCDTQGRWDCVKKKGNFQKMLDYCTKCGIGSWTEPGPSPSV
jgi:RHS repeat-associated protein